jgi:hypothetical protein
MKKLTRYSDFKSLKSDVQSEKLSSDNVKKIMLEFESFLSLLQSKFSIQKKTKTSYGKNSD